MCLRHEELQSHHNPFSKLQPLDLFSQNHDLFSQNHDLFSKNHDLFSKNHGLSNKNRGLFSKNRGLFSKNHDLFNQILDWSKHNNRPAKTISKVTFHTTTILQMA